MSCLNCGDPGGGWDFCGPCSDAIQREQQEREAEERAWAEAMEAQEAERESRIGETS